MRVRRSKSEAGLRGRIEAVPRSVLVGVALVAILLAIVASVDGLLEWTRPGPATVPVEFRVSLVIISAMALGLVGTASVLLPDSAAAHSEGKRLKALDDEDFWRILPLTQDENREIASDRSPELAPRVKNYAHLLLGLAGRMSHCHETYYVGTVDRTRTIEADYALSAHLISALRANLASLGDREETAVCFPVLVFRKGLLPDRLTVTWQGRRLAVTPHSDVHKLQLLTLRSLFSATYGPTIPQSLFNRAVDVIAWMGAPEVSAKLDPSSERAKLQKQRSSEQIDVTNTLIGQVRSQRKLRAIPKRTRGRLIDVSHLEKFLSVFSGAYPICVEIPSEALSDRLSLTIDLGESRLEFIDGFRDRLRMWLDIEPFKFRAPLTRMFISKSYHLTFKAHESQYLYSQRLVEPTQMSGSTPRVQRVSLANIQVGGGGTGRHVRLESWNHRSVGRFYARGFRSIDARPLLSQVRFHERPPGAMGTAASMVLLNFCLVGVFGYFASAGRFPSSLSFTSFLLALPALSLSILGRVRSPETRAFISLKARTGEILAMLLSLAAVILYAAEQSGIFTAPPNRLSLFGVVVPFDFLWLCLLVTSLTVGLLLAHASAVRMIDYQRRFARNISEQDEEVIPGRLDGDIHPTATVP